MTPARTAARAIRFLLIGALVMLPLPDVAAEGEHRLQAFLEGLHTYSAGFEQDLVNEYGEVLEQSVGVVYVERPGKFHWAYFDPYSQFIISDGTTLWVYDQDLAQVTIRDVTGAIDESPAAILGGDGDLDRFYVVIDLGVEDGLDWVELTPRDIESQYSTIRLAFDGGQVSRMVLSDNLGQQTRITFHDPRRNPALDESLFSLQPPAGADVIDGRAARTDD